MVCVVNISEAILEKTDLESSLEKVFACVLYTVFGGDSTHIYVSGVKQFEDLSQGLLGGVHAFESRVLLESLVASFVEGQLLTCIRKQFRMDASSSSACNAV